ncbi:hypothetical protein LOB25_05340 [Lactobacillus delbrueckii subsp. bulgaricus]|nr:hypothetical protein [Lactobacillus delbrueckii]MCD5481054.1 hypothetical protein [Lactobacillus delbrueckii subsp. bulgaricus]
MGASALSCLIVCFFEEEGMRIFMAVLWPILLVASAAMTTISYRKKKTGKADKDYYSVRGWGCLAFMSLLGVMMSYLPLGILSVGGCFFIAAFVLMYFAYSKKEHKLKVQKATAWLLLALSFVTVGVGSVAAEEYSPRTKVVVKYTGAKEYQQVKEKNAALISAKKAALLAYAPLAKKVKKLEAQEKAEKKQLQRLSGNRKSKPLPHQVPVIQTLMTQLILQVTSTVI